MEPLQLGGIAPTHGRDQHAWHLCEVAPCVSACPRNALAVRPEDGTIALEKALCTGFEWCRQACDFKAIAPEARTKSVVICDLCRDLPEPMCVESCPKKALSLSLASVVAGRSRKKEAEQLLRESSAQE